MGGRGGSRTFKSRKEKAREVLASRGKPEKRNVFISFAHEDLQQVNLLRGQAKNENSHIEFNDWSLSEPFDSERAEYVKAGIRERINPSSVTLVYVSESTPASKWVDWEVRESVRLGKGVVAVYSGSVPSDLPQALKELGVSPIPWTQAGLAKAIEDASSKGAPG